MRKCRVCKAEFEPQYNTIQPTCGWKCALKLVEVKRKEKEKKEFRAETVRRRAAAKTRSDWLRDAQTAFNAYIRARDRGKSCISCGLSEAELAINSLIKMVCGHYLSVGACPELRYDENNAHLQCTRCNGGAGKYGKFNNKAKTVTLAYRVNLVDKIGTESVEELEGPHEPKKYTIDDLKEIKAYYRDKVRILTSF